MTAVKINETTLQVSGMTCAACAIRIEKGLGKVDGVKEANVNLALERASVQFDPEKVTISDLEKKIEKLGYGTVKEPVELQITGMTKLGISCFECITASESKSITFNRK
jgi:Cu+-exporting ATPase